MTTRIGTAPEIADAANAVALQADDRIVVVGRTWQGHSNDFAVVRYNADGSLDATFGGDGKVTTDFTPTDPSLQFGARTVQPGVYRGMTVERPTIQSLGPSYDDAFAVVVQSDGKLVVGGTSLARYNSDGTLDSSFGKAGAVAVTAQALALQPDGKIVAVGWGSSFTIQRYTPDGRLDPSFGTGGTATTRIGRIAAAADVALLSDGKLVAVGKSLKGRSIDFAMVRYTPDGKVDTRFGKGGKVTSDYCAHKVPSQDADYIVPDSLSGGWRVQPQADGKILVTGRASDGLCSGAVMFRYNPDGSLDRAFGKNGMLTISFSSGHNFSDALAVQPDGKITVAGASGDKPAFAVARYNRDGSLDMSFGERGTVTTRIGAGYTVR